MTIDWYGQSCFRISSKDSSLLIDPFDKEIGLRAPRLNDNVYLVTHDHYDHNHLEGVDGEAFVVKGPGEYEVKDIMINGILSYHDNSNGSQRGLNTIYVINVEEMKICHLGDLGQSKLTQDQLEQIGDVDVLMIPVGGNYTIDAAQAVEIVSQIEPKIVIPMHYKIDGLKIDLDDNKKFIKLLGLKPEETDSFKINKKTLPQDENKLVVFQK